MDNLKNKDESKDNDDQEKRPMEIDCIPGICVKKM